jgi:hypothetical protein
MSTSYRQAAQELFDSACCYLGDVFDAVALQPELIEPYSTLVKLKGRRNGIRDYISLLGSRITGAYAGEDQVEIRAQGPALYKKLMELETRIKEVESQIKESKRRVVAAKPDAVAAEVAAKPAAVVAEVAAKPAAVVAEVAAKPAAVVAEVAAKPVKRKAPQPKDQIDAWNSKHVKKLCKRASKSRYPTPKETRKQ